MTLRLLAVTALATALTARLRRLGAFTPPAGPAASAATPLRPAPARWFKLPTEPFKGKQDDIVLVDEQLGFYVNGQGYIHRTRDGGLSWQAVLHQPGTYFRTIGMIDARHGFAGNIGTDYFPNVTDERPLYETDDGGNTAPGAPHPGTAGQGLCAIDIVRSRFINAGHLDERVIVHAGGRVGSPARLLRSVDGGATWDNIDMSPWVAMIVDVKFFDEMNGIVFAGTDAEVEKSHARIVATHDGGRTWSTVYESTRPFELTWKGSFPSRDVGYATIQNYDPATTETQRRIAKTTDGGRSWTELPLVDDAGVREFGIGFANEQLGWVGTSKGGFETRDGGAHWTPVNLGRFVNKVRVMPDGHGSFRAVAIGADVYKFDVPPAALPAASAPVAASVGKP